MTQLAARLIRAAAAAVLCGVLATSAGAQDAQTPTQLETIVLFFDVESAALSPQAKTIVLRAVDAAEGTGARLIELAAYASSDESARDPELATRRAEAVKKLLADYGFKGAVFIDHEAQQIPLAATGDDTFERSAVLRLGG